MPEYTRICQNMFDYARIFVNMPKSARMAFVFHVTIVIPFLLENVFTYFNKVYIYSLKEHEPGFLKRQNLIFSIVAGSI